MYYMRHDEKCDFECLKHSNREAREEREGVLSERRIPLRVQNKLSFPYIKKSSSKKALIIAF